MTLHDLLKEVRAKLVNFSEIEAEQILCAALSGGDPIDSHVSKLDLFSRFHEPVSEEVQGRARYFYSERLLGRPLQHILGFQEFLGRRYWVNSDVLVPRPETEALTQELIQRLKKIHPKTGIEVGIGSGAISISLLCEFKNLRIYSSECSEGAVDTALRNVERHSTGDDELRLRFELLVADELHFVQEPFAEIKGQSIDFVVSNPPYLAYREEVTDEVAKHEPQMALFAPEGDALFYYREISRLARRVLVKNGLLAFEIPHERSQEILRLLQNEGFHDIEIWKDLTGRDRGVFAYG